MGVNGNLTALSADIKVGNGKLALMLRQRDEDEALLTIGTSRIRDIAKSNQSGGRSSRSGLKQQADFSYPTPLIDRPRTASGNQSFHFSVTTISNTRAPTRNGKPIPDESSYGAGGGTQPALDHSKYIERDGAGERTGGARHASYVERDGAAEFSRSLDLSDVLGETLTTEEAETVGLEIETRDGTQSIFSNISDDPFERQEYWRAVERTERIPRSHSLLLYPSLSPAWWVSLDSAEKLDQSFRTHVLQVRAGYRLHQQLQATGTSVKPFKAEPYSATSDRAGEIIMQSWRIRGFDDLAPPILFESGRGGRVQIRFVAELPHEIDANDCAIIARNFCNHLATFSTDENGKPVGLMYTAVIHAPDVHNDCRNYHLHIVAHDRPARYLPDYGLWDFELGETYRTSGRQERVRYPYRQNKVGEVSQGRSKTGRANSGRDFIPAMRKEFARISNRILASKGVAKRYDPRKHSEMGIGRAPTEHLGTKAAALEALGVPTIIGKMNAIRIWTDVERSTDRACDAAEKAYKAEQASLKQMSARSVGAQLQGDAVDTLRQYMAERERLIANLAEDRRSVLVFGNLEAKAKSRAVRASRTCMAFLSEINAGRASAGTARLKPLYAKRFDEAQARIELVDLTLQPHRAGVAEMSISICAREERIVAIDRELAPIKSKLETRIRQLQTTAKTSSPIIPIRNIGDGTFVAGKARADTINATVVANPGTAPTKENSNAKSERSRLLSRVHSFQVALHKSAAADAGPGRLADALPSLRDVPSLNMVPNASQAELLLFGATRSDLGRGPEASDGVRRSRAGDRKVGAGDVALAGSAEKSANAPPYTAPSMPRTSGQSSKPFSAKEGSIVVPLAPPSIDGQPIVTPVLSATLITGMTQPLMAEDALNPVTPVKTPKPAPDHVAAPIAALRQLPPVDRASVAAASAARRPDAIVGPSPVAEDAALKVERREVPPTAQNATRGLGGKDEEYGAWKALMQRIIGERIPIRRKEDEHRGHQHSVPSLTAGELHLLTSVRFNIRSNSLLGSIYEKRRREIGHLLRWIDTEGRDPKLISFKDEDVYLAKTAPDSIRTLLDHWHAARGVGQAFCNEKARRDSLQSTSSNREVQSKKAELLASVANAASQLAELRERASEIYPSVDTVRTPEVKDFVGALLAADVDPAEMDELAHIIMKKPRACEEILRYGDKLIAAYNHHARNVDLRLSRGSSRAQRSGKQGAGR